MPEPLELYLHIPFCLRKCIYCDFLSFPAAEKTQDKYTDALCREIIKTGEVTPGYYLRSVFLGGGTPSILSIYNIERIMSSVRDSFSMDSQAEISMEANPGTLSFEKLLAYRKAGINRLSIGLQAADDSCLKMLGRIHTWPEFKENYL